MIAVLCAASRSVYKELPDLDVYDRSRDARSFPGGMPVIAHPPCRSWSAFCAHQAKPEEGERELGIWCCQMAVKNTGIVEQPAYSRLWAAAGLDDRSEVKIVRVWQYWWGLPMQKLTELAFCGIDVPEMPFRLCPAGDRQRWNKLSKSARAATPRAFAEWLIRAIREQVPCAD